MVESSFLIPRKRGASLCLGRFEIALAERELCKTESRACTAAGRGAFLGISASACKVEPVERDVGEVGQHCGFPIRPMDFDLECGQLFLELDRSVKVAGETRNLTSSGESLGKAAGREPIASCEGSVHPLGHLAEITVRD